MTIAAEIEPRLFYITAASSQEAEKIARDLLEHRLAACVNIFPGVKSFYRWQEKIDMSEETVMIVKTVSSRAEALMRHVETLHSYECPSILRLTVEDANAPFLSWLAAATAETE